MTWVILIVCIIFGCIKIILTCPPTSLVEWFLSKFEIHSKLNEQDVNLTIDGKPLEGEDKRQFIKYFNEATFLEKHYIYPGNENIFLNPENAKSPIIIDAKRGKENTKFIVYPYSNHVDVVKKYKKKMVAYSLLSERLQSLMD